MDDYERIHLIKQEVFVYKIPPLQSNRGARAAEWNLDNPDWTGRLKLVSKAGALILKLEDKSGALFAKAPIEAHPGVAVQPVSDSSRYFVVRLLNDNGQTAFIGIGFADRGDSFDLNVSLQDFFKEQTRDTTVDTAETTTITPAPKLDLAFKEGQTIHINFGNRSAQRERPSRPSAAPGSGPVPFLPPPPSGSVTRTTPVVQQQTQVQSGGGDSSNPFATTEQIDASTTQPNPFLSNPVTASSPQGGSLLEF